MEYLQYLIQGLDRGLADESFKPYYKWNTFNTISGLSLGSIAL